MELQPTRASPRLQRALRARISPLLVASSKTNCRSGAGRSAAWARVPRARPHSYTGMHRNADMFLFPHCLSTSACSDHRRRRR
jgi:hypothetical protein